MKFCMSPERRPNIPQDLRDKLSENTAPIQRLQSLAEQCLSSNDKSIQSMKEQYSRVMECWQTLNEGLATVEVAVVPWKELTDRFDELQDWFDELSEQVKQLT